MSALFDDDMSDISSFDDEESDDAASDNDSHHDTAAVQSENSQVNQSLPPSESQEVDLTISGADEVETADAHQFSALLGLLQESPDVTYGQDVADVKSATSPQTFFAVHVAQTADSVESVPGLRCQYDQVVEGHPCVVTENYFTCATYQQHGTDRSTEEKPTATSTSTQADSDPAVGDASRKYGMIYLFCLRTTTASSPVADGTAEKHTLHLLDVVDSGSAVFDIAWIFDQSLSEQPVMAVACADAAIRLYTPVRVRDGTATSELNTESDTWPGGADVAEDFKQTVNMDMFRTHFHLRSSGTWSLDRGATAQENNGGVFDNRTVRVLSIRWDHSSNSTHAARQRRLLSTHSDGSAALWLCRPSAPNQCEMQFVFEWDAHSYFGAPSEVWCACFAAHSSKIVFTGADDGRLKMWQLETALGSGDGVGGNGSAILLQQHHFGLDGHGVTVMRVHSSGILTSGSYDGSICIWNPLHVRDGPLRKLRGSGGVWRLQWLPVSTASGVTSPRHVLLAACMRGGARILSWDNVFPFCSEQRSLASTPRAREAVRTIQCSSHEPESIVYGAAWLAVGHNHVVGTCSFYDCHLTLWDPSVESFGRVEGAKSAAQQQRQHADEDLTKQGQSHSTKLDAEEPH